MSFSSIDVATAPRLLSQGDPGFPASVAALSGRRARGLWIWGAAPQDVGVAIVGSRSASGRGKETAQTMARDLGLRGRSVISGGAFGIDAAAHEGALEAGASTFAVLGCGIDVVYPDRHATLFRRIRSAPACGLVSEYGPGTMPRRGQFPVRNRIIVALSRAVVVVEAAPRSGALVTARLAREHGRLLLAVRGSAGTDALIASGEAIAVADADDVGAVMSGGTPRRESPGPVPQGTCGLLLDAIAAGAHDPHMMMTNLGVSLPEILAALCEAELGGWVIQRANGSYEVIRGHQ